MCLGMKQDEGKVNIEKTNRIGFSIKKISNLMGRYLKILAKEQELDDVTVMHGWIIGYLYDHRGQDVYQKDIERTFSITKSTVTNILQLMEKKGYITRASVPGDGRLKRLELTDEGLQCQMHMEQNIMDLEKLMDSTFTKEEQQQFFTLLKKLDEKLMMELKDKFGAEFRCSIDNSNLGGKYDKNINGSN